MASIKNVCHRCRHTWRLKGEHLSTHCPKCGSPYVGPAAARGIGLFGLLLLAGAAFGGAVWFGFIDPKDLPEVPGLPGTAKEAEPPAKAPAEKTPR